MTTQKTQPTDADVGEFLQAAIPNRRREDGVRLGSIFSEVTGTTPVMWGPSIVGYGQYQYISPSNPGNRGVWPKTGFSPRKAQLSLYGLKDTPAGASLLPSLGTYTEGAGCVYVRKLEDIDGRSCAGSSPLRSTAQTIPNPRPDDSLHRGSDRTATPLLRLNQCRLVMVSPCLRWWTEK